MKKALAIVLVMTLLLSLASVAFAEEPGTKKLIVWSYMNEGEMIAGWHEQVVEEFNKAYPDVEVELVFCGRDVLSKFRPMLADTESADFPDMISSSVPIFIPLVRDGILTPLDEYVNTPGYESDKSWKDTFVPQMIELVQTDGSIYFLPEGMYSSGFFYDNVLFEKYNVEVPTTWDDFLAACETFKANGIVPLGLDGALDNYNTWYFVSFAERIAGPDALKSAFTGETLFADNPAFLDAAQKIYSLQEKGYFQPGFEGSVFPGAQALLTQGTCAMFFCGAWFPTEMLSQTPPEMQMRMFAVPEFDNAVSPRHVELWGQSWAITKDAKNVDNAVNFLKILTSPKMNELKVEKRNPSPLIGVTPVTELSNLTEIVSQATSVSTMYGDLTVINAELYSTILSPLATKLICGQVTPEEFIAQLDADIVNYNSNR